MRRRRSGPGWCWPHDVGIYLAIYDAVVAKLTTAQGSTLSMVKQIFQGDDDSRDISNSTPCLIVVPESNEGETWTSLPKRRDAQPRIIVRCVTGADEVIAEATPVRAAIRLAELVMDVLDTDPGLASTVELMNVTIRPFGMIGASKYAFEVVVDTQKRFQGGLR